MRKLCVVLGALIAGCGAPAPPAETPVRHAGGRCGDAVGASPFKRSDATHILVADFFSSRSAERDLGETVAHQIDDELRRFKEETLRDPQSFDIEVPESALEIERLRCFVGSHEQARRIADALDADVVLWGKAYCNPESTVVVDNRSNVRVSELKTGDNAVINIGKTEVHAAKPYSVCPSATLSWSDRDLRASDRHELTSLAELDLPRMQSTKPFGLIQFALGLHFYERENYWLAARFFQRSEQDVLVHERNVETLDLYLGMAYLHLPDFKKSIEFSQRALGRASDTDPLMHAALLNNIGGALQEQGDYAGAIEHFRRALVIDKKALGMEHPSTARDLNNIGLALAEQGNNAAAIEHYRRALTIDEKVLGKEHPSTARDLSNIGLVLARQGDYAAAIEHYRRALAINENVLGKGHPSTAKNLNNIGSARDAQGDYASAIEHYRRALAIDEKVLGKEHPSTARSLNNIGSAHHAQGDYAAAIEHYRRALTISEKTLGKDHPTVAATLNNVGVALAEQGDYAAAIEHYRRALTIDETALGRGHPSTARDINNIGLVLAKQGDYAAAIEHYRRALTIDETALGKDHPSTARYFNNIGGARHAQGDYAAAIEHYRRALTIDETALGKDHPSTARDLNNIGGVLHEQRDYAAAIEHFRRALAVNETALGKDHPTVAATLNNIGLVLAEQGNYAAAIEHFRRAIAVFVARLGDAHPSTRAVRSNLALTLAQRSGWARDGSRGGVVVLRCTNDSCAGLTAGDWITVYDAAKVRSAQHLIELTQATSTKRSVKVTLRRDGKPIEITAPGGRLGIELH
ncbi:tetratricopeptide repeat protein [Sorangium sp. So ce302]|uniref:tetratricopeptide repeat protein n=1 Tax=Sorangium sp. So ce302 TaxID=3133297 RepID=UPI003F5DBA66